MVLARISFFGFRVNPSAQPTKAHPSLEAPAGKLCWGKYIISSQSAEAPIQKALNKKKTPLPRYKATICKQRATITDPPPPSGKRPTNKGPSKSGGTCRKIMLGKYIIVLNVPRAPK